MIQRSSGFLLEIRRLSGSPSYTLLLSSSLFLLLLRTLNWSLADTLKSAVLPELLSFEPSRDPLALALLRSLRAQSAICPELHFEPSRDSLAPALLRSLCAQSDICPELPQTLRPLGGI